MILDQDSDVGVGDDMIGSLIQDSLGVSVVLRNLSHHT